MGIAIETIAPTTALTTVARMRSAGLAFPVGDNADVERLINAASAAIVNYCGRPFARETLTETCAGFGDLNLALARTPIVTVDAVIAPTEVPVTDYSIGNADRGWLYRRGGWAWSVQWYPGLSTSTYADRFLFGPGVPLPDQDETIFRVTYTAGYILPPQYLIDVQTISAVAADNSFNDSAGGFPPSVKANDVVELFNFTNAANNGRFHVTGTPTPSKITVNAALVDEPATPGGGAKLETMVFHPPAQCRPFDEIERAVFETVKSWYSGRGRDSAIVERQMSSTRVRWSETEAARMMGLPPSCVGLLRAWRRIV
jgi:hypothetical protein